MLKKLTLFFILLLGSTWAFAQDIADKDLPPKSNTIVTDYTTTLSDADRQQLESKLEAYDDSSSVQIAVVIMKSVGDYDIDVYGTSLIRKWGIGQKGKDNGVLMIVAMEDHKIGISTGYGAEGPVPDATAKLIIDQDMRPRFKQGDFYGGFVAAANDIIKATHGEFKGNPHAQHAAAHNTGGAGIIVFIIIVIVLIIIFRNRGGGGQIIGGRGGASPFWWFLAGDMLGSAGRGGGGGGWGGFSGGGDSGGGGGWGGFGGGSAGGGGASGGW